MIRKLLFSAAIVTALGAQAEVRAHYPVTSYDFGAFSEESGPVSCDFPIVNTGTEPLAIISARATCGCTQPKYSTEAIAPGDTTYVHVTYDPQGRPGRFNKQIYIETNAEPPKMRLDIRGAVIGAPTTVNRRFPHAFGPLKMEHPGMMMGEIRKGEYKTAYFNGYNQSADSLHIRITRVPDFIQIVSAPEVGAPGEQVSLVAFIDASKCELYGLVEDTVTIAPGDGHEYAMPMTLLVNEDFSQLTPKQMKDAPVARVESEVLDFGMIDPAAKVLSKTFTLSNGGKDRLELRRVYSGDAGVSAVAKDSSVKGGKHTEITVNVDTAALKGKILNARLLVITNDPVNPTRIIRLVGEK